MKKKSVAIFCSAMLATAALAGCGENTAAPATGNDAPAATAAATEAPAATEAVTADVVETTPEAIQEPLKIDSESGAEVTEPVSSGVNLAPSPEFTATSEPVPASDLAPEEPHYGIFCARP